MAVIEVMLPTKPADAGSIALADRPGSLEGGTLGFIWNSKPNADVLFDEFVSRIGHPTASVKRHLKPNAAVPATDDVYDAFARDCTAAVVALGD